MSAYADVGLTAEQILERNLAIDRVWQPFAAAAQTDNVQGTPGGVRCAADVDSTYYGLACDS